MNASQFVIAIENILVTYPKITSATQEQRRNCERLKTMHLGPAPCADIIL